MARHISTFYFDSRQDAWVQYSKSDVEPASLGPVDGQQPFRVATFNILADCFPWFVRLAIASELRFESLVQQLDIVNATVIGLNEVTVNSLRVLLGSRFVRNNYFVSELDTDVNGSLVAHHGCVILSKIPFESCVQLPPLQWPDSAGSSGAKRREMRMPIVGVFDVPASSGNAGSYKVAVCSLHTQAFQTLENKQRREEQIAQCVEYMRSLPDVQGFTLLGDLNLHYVNEDGVGPANRLLDCWAETHFRPGGDMDPGYTFDAESNYMIRRYIPGESRRMRLDRIYISEGGCLGCISPCELFGLVPCNEIGNVFLSDHYGLVSDLSVGLGAGAGDPHVKLLLKENGKQPLNAAGVSYVRFSAALIPHAGWLTLRFLGAL
mmetsp:Transcript_6388/g.13969  ORF Transcript_6388/g.13969 Transcript_6388/m.13969 type:complete len:378 (+) Transcript_6388:49-1182(+)